MFLPAVPLETKLLIAAALLLAGFATGWQVHSWKVGAAQAKQVRQDVKTAAKIADESAQIITQRDEAKENTITIYRTIKEKIHAQNDRRMCFGADALSLWNAAIAGANQYRAEPAETPETNDPTNPTVQADSSTKATAPEPVSINVQQVLSNAADNFETCHQNSIDHNALIDRVESLKGKMCVCGGQ